MKKLLTFAVIVFTFAALAQITITVKQTFNADQEEALRYLWRTSGAKTNGIPLKDFATNYVELKLSDQVVISRAWRLEQISKKLAAATDDQIAAVEAALGL